MKRFLMASAAALMIATAPSLSQAQSAGPYASAGMGFSQMRDTDITGTGIDTKADHKAGFAASAAVGNAFGNGFRAEVEGNFRQSGYDNIGGADASGHSTGWGLMLNGLYDFSTGTKWTPYLGAGIGFNRTSASGASPVSTTRIDDSDWGFGYQGIAGIAYKLSNEADVFGEYRYAGTEGINLTTGSGVNVDADNAEHRFLVGLRWFFGAPKPAPMAAPVQAPAPAPVAKPAPAPAPAPEVRRFLVFFDWDKSAITADAKAILTQAAKYSKDTKVTRIEATGHADRSGTDKYNLALSKRRAEAVKAELVKLGIPAKLIDVKFKGEREPLVQTPDGVREPQNRRVEIVLN